LAGGVWGVYQDDGGGEFKGGLRQERAQTIRGGIHHDAGCYGVSGVCEGEGGGEGGGGGQGGAKAGWCGGVRGGRVDLLKMPFNKLIEISPPGLCLHSLDSRTIFNLFSFVGKSIDVQRCSFTLGFAPHREAEEIEEDV